MTMLRTILGLVATMGSTQAFAALAPHVPGELIVKLKSGEEKSFFQGLKSLGVTHQRDIKLGYGTFYVVKTEAKSLESVQKALALNPSVEYAEPNFIYSIVKPSEEISLDSIIGAPRKYSNNVNFSAPRDPDFGKLWGLANTGNNEPNGTTPGIVGADIDALRAWTLTKGSRAIRIAVIDTGIDYNHPDLAANMWVNQAEKDGQPGVDDDGNGYVDDIHGYDFANKDGDPLDDHSHGTHCAGTIGAVHDNGIGVAGVMADVELVGVKFLTGSGSGSLEDALLSIDYATKIDVDLMSNSWGGGGFSQALFDAIKRASDAGIIFTAAAGNDSANNDSSPHYPSNYDLPNVVSVAASTAQDDLATFSCYGRRTVHVAAPGHRIYSTVKNGGYAVYSGTSMATPHVSGALGLLLSHEGRMPHDEMRDRLMGTSVPVTALRGRTVNGGRLNAYNLLTDTRPARNEPNPNAWVKVTLNEAWESAHPYGHNANTDKSFSVPGAKYIRLRVKKYDLETNYDYIQVSTPGRQLVEKVSGAGTDYVTDYVEGDSLIATFKSDGSVAKWGFIIEDVEVQY
jgi:subtilisin family serine protease